MHGRPAKGIRVSRLSVQPFAYTAGWRSPCNLSHHLRRLRHARIDRVRPLSLGAFRLCPRQ